MPYATPGYQYTYTNSQAAGGQYRIGATTAAQAAAAVAAYSPYGKPFYPPQQQQQSAQQQAAPAGQQPQYYGAAGHVPYNTYGSWFGNYPPTGVGTPRVGTPTQPPQAQQYAVTNMNGGEQKTPAVANTVLPKGGYVGQGGWQGYVPPAQQQGSVPVLPFHLRSGTTPAAAGGTPAAGGGGYYGAMGGAT